MRLSILYPISAIVSCATLAFAAPTAVPLITRANAHSSQLVSFPASKAYLANSASAIKSFATTLLNGRSGVTLYYGIQIEDTSKGWLLLDGYSLSAADKTALAAIKASSSSAITTRTISFPATNSIPSIFTAGETELTTLTLKSGVTMAQVIPGMNQLVAQIKAAKGGVDAVYETNLQEHPGTFEIVAGWTSLAAHTAATSTTSLVSVITPLLSLLDLSPANVVFHKF